MQYTCIVSKGCRTSPKQGYLHDIAQHVPAVVIAGAERHSQLQSSGPSMATSATRSSADSLRGKPLCCMIWSRVCGNS